MKIACIGDSHFNSSKRLEDNIEVHRDFVEQARAEGVDYILHGGDFFDRRSNPEERNALAEFIVACSEVAPVFGVRGNHDIPGDLDIFNLIEGRGCQVEILDRPGPAKHSPNRIVPIGLPWITKAHIVASSGVDATADETTDRTIRAARAMLDSIRALAHQASDAGLVPVIVGHVQIGGARTSSAQILIGDSVELSAAELADLGCAYVHLSHIHEHQSWPGNVVYSGSPQRQDFSEVSPRGWVLVEVDPQRWREPGGVRWEFRELPARRIVLLEAEHRDGAMAFSAHDVGPGDLVRFRYRVRPEDLHLVDEAGIVAALRHAGAHDVKCEPVLLHQARVRSEAITTARTTMEKLRSFWVAKQIPISEEQASRIERKLQEIEAREEVAV